MEELWTTNCIEPKSCANIFLKLYTVMPYFENSVDPDQLASDEASWWGSALYSMQPQNSLY